MPLPDASPPLFSTVRLRTLLAWTGAAFALLALAASLVPQGFHFFDPVLQSLALQQYEAGVSPSWNVLMRVDPHDLARDLPEFITWWPPSTQCLVLPLHRAGLSPAAALRFLALLAIALGSIGWITWFRRFALPRIWLFALAIALPWLHAFSVFLFRYSADALALAAAPWILLLYARLLQRLQSGTVVPPGVALLLGLATGVTFGLKYSLGVIAFAALASVWAWLLATRRTRAARDPAFKPLSLATVSAVLFPLAWHLVTRHLGGTMPSDQAFTGGFDPMGLVFFLANPALALADLSAPLFFLFVYPGVAPLATGTLNTVAWIGFPGGLLLAWLLVRAVRHDPGNECKRVGVVTLAATSVALLVLWYGADVSHESRLIAPAALGVLPVALEEGRRLWATSHAWLLRALLAVAAGLFVALPLAFGPCYVTAKIRRDFSCHPGPTGLNLPTLQARDIFAARRELIPFHHPKAIWVITDPELAMELPGRSTWLTSGRSIGEDLQNVYAGRSTLSSWRTSEARELLVLLPSDGDPALPRILASASRVQTWQRTLLRQSSLILWRGWLEPTP